MALALVAAMAATAAPAAAHNQTPDRAQPAQRLTLANSDNGRSVIAHLGDGIEVRLTGYRASGLTWTWSTPAASDSAVLRRTAGRTAPNGDASAVFHAEHGGTATITAQRRCRPDAGHVCPMVITPWKVTVEVK
ncbi:MULTISPECIES: hypothetical protein [Streptomyces]|uniref:hypothetical protein n=1 Tax=Streptomyces TaxID=1883 RepID=UPI00163C6766|nr:MULTISPECIES: hypothetical protein [Streptomyces]MBC2878423.1 hypothetical protein [Streptomyces sp. TYQ1024]UBI38759.1 hypothetical protein K7I03_21410 [Streptomyces mobaraensis]UKW31340.1 hypothetical protein MCU78_21360 [Streptomyces sp. TYQ1024]